MNNFTTNKEYTGSNITTLEDAGFDESNEFATFKQAVKFWDLTGKELKGAKSVARLMKIVIKKQINKKTGQLEDKKVPITFAVFEKLELLKVIESNKI
mgnify:FL=1|jgi:hypothetical protein|tara:strand:- start:351 stop:644 length:294 start_codon:yes stop_codon:yes gene_type:complete